MPHTNKNFPAARVTAKQKLEAQCALVKTALRQEIAERLKKSGQWNDEQESMLAKLETILLREGPEGNKRFVLKIIVPHDDGVYLQLLNDIGACKKARSFQNGMRFTEYGTPCTIFSASTWQDLCKGLNEKALGDKQRLENTQLDRLN